MTKEKFLPIIIIAVATLVTLAMISMGMVDPITSYAAKTSFVKTDVASSTASESSDIEKTLRKEIAELKDQILKLNNEIAELKQANEQLQQIANQKDLRKYCQNEVYLRANMDISIEGSGKPHYALRRNTDTNTLLFKGKPYRYQRTDTVLISVLNSDTHQNAATKLTLLPLRMQTRHNIELPRAQLEVYKIDNQENPEKLHLYTPYDGGVSGRSEGRMIWWTFVPFTEEEQAAWEINNPTLISELNPCRRESEQEELLVVMPVL